MLQITKVNRKEIQTTNNKVQNFQITKIGKKREQLYVVDFICVHGQQQFEGNAETQSKSKLKMKKFNKCSKNTTNTSLALNFFLLKTEKMFLVTNGLPSAKYSLINGELFQTIDVLSLSETENWEEIKTSSWWVNVNFQSQTDNRSVKHFSYNFST